MKVAEKNIIITKETEDILAEKYNNFIERKEEFEKNTKLEVIEPIDNYQYCIIRNVRQKYILGKVYNNCISIGSGIIIEFNNIKDLINTIENSKELKQLVKLSKI